MPHDNNKLYLIDANIVIHAHDYYYHMQRVPEFWSWLLFHAKSGVVKMPFETMDEVKGGKEALHAQWIKSKQIKEQLLFEEGFDGALLNHVIDNGYAPDLNDVELDKIGADPFLISYAMADPSNRVVISNEVSKPSKQRGNRKVPDVCRELGLQCHNVYYLLRELNFTTKWQAAL